MNFAEYESAVAALTEKAAAIEVAKRPGYTQASEDVLANFKVSGARCGVTAMQAWGVHFEKHVSAIMSYAKDPNIPQAEELMGRFADAVNYLKLGFALYAEQQIANAEVCG